MSDETSDHSDPGIDDIADEAELDHRAMVFDEPRVRGVLVYVDTEYRYRLVAVGVAQALQVGDMLIEFLGREVMLAMLMIESD